MKKEFYTAVTVPGHHLLHSPLMWRLFIPPNLLRRRVGKVNPFLLFLPVSPTLTALIPKGASLSPQVIYLTLEPLSSLASSSWTSIFFTHVSLSLHFPKSTFSFAVGPDYCAVLQNQETVSVLSGPHFSLEIIALFPEHFVISDSSAFSPTPVTLPKTLLFHSQILFIPQVLLHIPLSHKTSHVGCSCSILYFPLGNI